MHSSHLAWVSLLNSETLQMNFCPVLANLLLLLMTQWIGSSVEILSEIWDDLFNYDAKTSICTVHNSNIPPEILEAHHF